MSFSNNNDNMVMPVAPMYGGGYGNGGGMFGDNGWWVILLLLCGWGGGFGMGGFGGGFGNMMLGYDFPWLLNGQNGINNNVNDGFRDAQLHDSVTSVRDGVSNLATQLCGCCGDMQMSMANGFAGVQQGFAGTAAAITAAQNGITQQLYNNEIASLNRSFDAQTANSQGFNGVQAQFAQCCCDNRLATENLKYVVAQENCADRYEAAQNTRDIIDSQTRGTQAILDKLCALELDGVKGQLAQAQRENVALQNAVNMATMQASQVAQTADIINGTYTRLSQCPVNSTPVYGNQPIFTCPNNNNNFGCGCGCAA